MKSRLMVPITSQWEPSEPVNAHKSGVSSLAVSPKYVATGASDGTVKLWALLDQAGMSN